VDNPLLVPELSPELSFDRVKKIGERRGGDKRHPLMNF
jgi:hypothetical protein